jgi:hypothetical protein
MAGCILVERRTLNLYPCLAPWAFPTGARVTRTYVSFSPMCRSLIDWRPDVRLRKPSHPNSTNKRIRLRPRFNADAAAGGHRCERDGSNPLLLECAADFLRQIGCAGIFDAGPLCAGGPRGVAFCGGSDAGGKSPRRHGAHRVGRTMSRSTKAFRCTAVSFRAKQRACLRPSKCRTLNTAT